MSYAKTETDQADRDLNEVIAVLHREIERGYVLPGQAIALAKLITDAREKAIHPDPCGHRAPFAVTSRVIECVLPAGHDSLHEDESFDDAPPVRWLQR